ncbi:lipase member I isoform 3 precursor [Homo sapiens]|uniref:Isoform 3 of Lipase member I n=1 Tax=Homo sapiens TaxID=9606 RepID=Q6XZB0-3|nr:lipase member I isoform 3 precursor [Homo sapiens]|eukprot:NP_001289929.1 lipase member I isoform 3 precursor [Homo sapiens]
MRVYIFLCLMCWVRSDNKRPCLEFSQLSVKDSFRDLFIPRIETILMMYTRNNLNCAEPLFEQNNSLNVNFNTQKKTVWLIHGYRPVGSIPLWLQNFVRILLNEEDMNVIVVDWSRGATTFIYNRAVKNTRKVAVSLSVHIKNLLKHGASLDNFHFIGVSLGAHISGFVGKIFHGQLGRITGLDPAGPRFSRKPPYSRLDYTDAKFVDVIHSDSNGLGIQEPLGHIDFYPNGGNKQPGCPKSIFSGIQFIKCNHQRAVHLFMASLETNCNFISFPCRSYKDYKTSLCVDCDCFKEKSCPRLGYQAKLFKGVLKERMEGRPLRTTVFLDTSAYYFVLSIIVPDKTMMDGSFSFKLLNQLGMIEEPRLYEKNKPFYKLQEVKILAQFYNDFVNISSIGLTYFQSSNLQCSTCTYKIQSLMLKSLTYPERPPLCRYNIVLKDREEVFLNPNTCTPKNT